MQYDADSEEKARCRRRYNEQVGRRRAEAYGQEVRDAGERERHRQALRCHDDVHGEKRNLRRLRDEESREKAASGKRERIRVYASPDLR